MNFRCYADNVLLLIEPPESETKSGLALVHMSGPGAKEHRFARVVASGPGHKRPCCGAFVPNETKPGDRVIVSALAGDKVKWDWDVSAPRQNAIPEFDHVAELRGQIRLCREEEILAIVEDVAVAAE